MKNVAGWVTLPDGTKAVRFPHETDADALARYDRVDTHRETLFEAEDPAVADYFRCLREATKRLDDARTVWANGRRYVLPEAIVEALLREIRPRMIPAGTHGLLMRERQHVRRVVAALLDIPIARVPDIIAQLRANRLRVYGA